MHTLSSSILLTAKLQAIFYKPFNPLLGAMQNTAQLVETGARHKKSSNRQQSLPSHSEIPSKIESSATEKTSGSTRCSENIRFPNDRGFLYAWISIPLRRK
jgi:hypothetical protein